MMGAWADINAVISLRLTVHSTSDITPRKTARGSNVPTGSARKIKAPAMAHQAQRPSGCWPRITCGQSTPRPRHRQGKTCPLPIFWERHYLPYCEKGLPVTKQPRLKASTVRGYKGVWTAHLKNTSAPLPCNTMTLPTPACCKAPQAP